MKWIAKSALLLLSAVAAQDYDTTAKHSNHIFNEIHSSGRQWGSTLNHNGMAFFIATVPEGTELYHGTGSPEPKQGMDWLAFEPEHALVFARPGSNRNSDDQEPDGERQTYGFLHTYQTKRDLRLLYLDGASAAKSDRGTLDLQEVVLLHSKPRNDFGRRSAHEHHEDSARASKMCKMAEVAWQGRIDGFVRMEAGFEIILCDIAAHLETVRITQSRSFDGPPGMIPDSRTFFKAISARYDGVGGERMTVEYDHHVSLFAFPGAVYFDRLGRPRANHTSQVLNQVGNSVTSMVQSRSSPPTKGTNWQAVTDMIVSRYADRISHLASGSITSLDEFQMEAEKSLRPFIDYGNLNRTAEVARCKDHFIRWHARGSSGIAAQAVTEVNAIICETLSMIAHTKLKDLSDGLSFARALKKWLAWTEWKKCNRCQPDEFCFIPLWPLGSAEDFEKPRCVRDFKDVGRDYWHQELPSSKTRQGHVVRFSLDSRRPGKVFGLSNNTCPAALHLGVRGRSQVL